MIKIVEGTIEEAIAVEREIPEFERQAEPSEYLQTLDRKRHKILIAKDRHNLVAFKVGYEDSPGELYSWLGGVKPDYRKQGIASHLMKEQESWAKNNGFKLIKVNTYNKYQAMICLLVSSEYQLIEFESHQDIQRCKLTYIKHLK